MNPLYEIVPLNLNRIKIISTHLYYCGGSSLTIVAS